jgi:hypothetical protein
MKDPVFLAVVEPPCGMLTAMKDPVFLAVVEPPCGMLTQNDTKCSVLKS